jgi:hypothetical protein
LPKARVLGSGSPEVEAPEVKERCHLVIIKDNRDGKLMALILWERWQREHIGSRHGVTKEDFDTAWHDPDREDFEQRTDERYGPYFASLGYTADGRLLEMIWRWQQQRPGQGEVWPITAYFIEED